MTSSILRMSDLSPGVIVEILDASEQRDPQPVLAAKGAALLFEHPSNRTRNAAEMAVFQLGGHPITIRGEEVGIDRRESAEDIVRTLASYHALIGARVTDHRILDRFVAALTAKGSTVPIINLLSDSEHPSQALADLLTIRQEFGSLSGQIVAFIGDANNVCRSLVAGCVLAGMEVRVASPAGFSFTEEEVDGLASLGKGSVAIGSPHEVADGATVLYTDVWISMGEEAEASRKRLAFSGYTIDSTLVSKADEKAIVMHCLPAHRGEEITADVIEGRQSRVWQQAENRMHALRGMMLHLLRA